MLALLLALSSDCTGLVPPMPAPLELTAGSASDQCGLMSVDGSGDVAAYRNAQRVFFASDGTLLAVSDAQQVWIGTPAQARGWFGLQYPASAGGSPIVYAVDRDGTLLGQTQLADTGANAYALLGDPRGGLVLLTTFADAGAWRMDLRRFSAAAALVDGPRTIASGKGSPPPRYEWDGWVAADGTILVTTQGTWIPPLRNNQLVARWFDPAGGPVTPWFVAVDQTTEGDLLQALPDGMALWSDAGNAAIRPGAVAVSAAPPWVAPPALDGPIFVLPDRIAVARMGTNPCEKQLDILAPAGNLCGTLHFPMATDTWGNCSYQYGPTVAADGTVVQERYSADSCRLHSWPRLLGR
ncbi:MAG: hypothetical protein ACXWLM_07435 [Myxococcales bacterium]